VKEPQDKACKRCGGKMSRTFHESTKVKGAGIWVYRCEACGPSDVTLRTRKKKADSGNPAPAAAHGKSWLDDYV